jgi:hypothetical protein
MPREFCCVVLPGGYITGHWPEAFLKPVPTIKIRLATILWQSPIPVGTGFSENKIIAISRSFGKIDLFVEEQHDGRIYTVKSRRRIEIKFRTKRNGIESLEFIRFIPGCRR